MNNKHAKELSKTITIDQIVDMLEAAKVGVKDWTKASKANNGLSRGVHWNMFGKDFNPEDECSNMLKYRMIQEYGDFLPKELQPPKMKKKKEMTIPVHHNPIFNPLKQNH